MVAGLVIFVSAAPADACAGPVVDTSLCEGVRLREAILAAALVGSALVAAALVIGALILSRERADSR
ncbi:CDP-diglyceride synthetase [Microbacterium testaceum]|uniref:CDP-diglyceride synthetase n=1 Tax=Microbacterium testaceum TaxID=2033 RepID=UPI0011D1A7EE|nr:CDP-diglyceride synthetase [Microbacterium testaceum]